MTVGPNITLVDPQPNNMEAWVNEALASNLQIQVSQAGLDFASKEVERNRACALCRRSTRSPPIPKPGNGAGTTTALGLDSTNRIIGLQLAVPIYQGGLTTSRVREALANQEKIAPGSRERAPHRRFCNAPGLFSGSRAGLRRSRRWARRSSRARALSIPPASGRKSG
jgi:hypothetical protein